MVCTKCAAKQKPTSLATPAVKRKTEHYYGSAASNSTSADNKATKSSTTGNTGIGKSKLLGKSAKNPYAAYSSSCDKCKTKVSQGHKFCHACAYKDNRKKGLSICSAFNAANADHYAQYAQVAARICASPPQVASERL